MVHKGQTLAGRYRLLERLGAGALGEVWAVRDERTERELALKLLRPGWKVAATSLESFYREIKAAAKIRHPSILELVDVGEVEDDGASVPYVAMELLEAEKLEQLLERVHALQVGTALRLCAELAWALVAAHEKGIVHERIEPANVLMHRDAKGEVVPKLVDFGVARLVEDLAIAPGAPHDALSPLAYLSPEQIHADVELDGRADVYGLAALVHRMLVGEPPFDGDEVEGILRQIEEGPKKLEAFEPPIDRKVTQLLADSLQRNRKLRPTMRVFAERVDALLERIEPQWRTFSALVRVPEERTIEHLQKVKPARAVAKVTLLRQARPAGEESARESAVPPPSLEPEDRATGAPVSLIIQERMRTSKPNALSLDVLADLEKELLKHVARPSVPSAEARVPTLDDIFGGRPAPAPESAGGTLPPRAEPSAVAAVVVETSLSPPAVPQVHPTMRVMKAASARPEAAAASEPPERASTRPPAAPPKRSPVALWALVAVALAGALLFYLRRDAQPSAPASATPSVASSGPVVVPASAFPSVAASVPPPALQGASASSEVDAAPALDATPSVASATPSVVPSMVSDAASAVAAAPVAGAGAAATAPKGSPAPWAAKPPALTPPTPAPPTAAPPKPATTAPPTSATPAPAKPATPAPPKPVDPTYGVESAGF